MSQTTEQPDLFSQLRSQEDNPNYLSKTASEAYLENLRKIVTHGEYVKVGSDHTFEVMGNTICFDMKRPVVSLVGRGLNYRFMAAEALYILEGRNIIDDIVRVMPTFIRYSDDGLTQSGAYGPKIMDQMSYIVACLNEDPNSRRAVINIWRERPGKTVDTPCTLSMQFLNREGCLHTFVSMRSSDAYVGLAYDMFCFAAVSQVVAFLVGCESLGSCFITAASSHIYEKNSSKIGRVLEAGLQNSLEVRKPYEPEEYFDVVFKLNQISRETDQIVARQMLLRSVYE